MIYQELNPYVNVFLTMILYYYMLQLPIPLQLYKKLHNHA